MYVHAELFSVSLARKGAWSGKDTQVATTIRGMASRRCERRHQGVAIDTHDRRSQRQTGHGHPDTHCPGRPGVDGIVKSLRPSARCRHHDAWLVTTQNTTQAHTVLARRAIRCAVRCVLYGSTRDLRKRRYVDDPDVQSIPFLGPISQPLDTWLAPPSEVSAGL